MKAWKQRPLGELLDVQNGYAFSSDFFNASEGIPLIRIRDLRNGKTTETRFAGSFPKEFIVRNGDLLIGMDGEFRCYAWKGEEALLNQRVCRLVNFSDEIDPTFIQYGLDIHLRQIEENTSYVTVKHLSSRSIKSICFAYPPLPEQQRIVARIKECMDRIDEIEQLRLAAISESRALTTAVFGDFLHDLASEGVATVSMGSVLSDVRYGTSQKATSDPIGVPVLRMGNIQGGRIKTDDLKYISLPPADLAKYKLLDGDILINRTNSLELVGKAGLFTGLQGDWVYASYLVRLRVNPSLVLPEYVNAVINSRVGRDYVLRTARRAIGMVNINAQEIRRLQLPLPSLEVQASVVERIRQSEVLIDQISEEIGPAIGSPMRAAVLRRAFAGEL